MLVKVNVIWKWIERGLSIHVPGVRKGGRKCQTNEMNYGSLVSRRRQYWPNPYKRTHNIQYTKLVIMDGHCVCALNTRRISFMFCCLCFDVSQFTISSAKWKFWLQSIFGRAQRAHQNWDEVLHYNQNPDCFNMYNKFTFCFHAKSKAFAHLLTRISLYLRWICCAECVSRWTRYCHVMATMFSVRANCK